MNRKITNKLLDKIFKFFGIVFTLFGLIVLLVLLADIFLMG
jgi:hypothetical protein